MLPFAIASFVAARYKFAASRKYVSSCVASALVSYATARETRACLALRVDLYERTPLSDSLVNVAVRCALYILGQDLNGLSWVREVFVMAQNRSALEQRVQLR